jgi:hypothetical protein
MICRLLLVLVLVSSSVTALCARVDPNSTTGIAASVIDGANVFILCTSGEVWVCGSDDWAQNSLYPPTTPIPVAEIVDWTPMLFLAVDGTVWRFNWDGDSNYWTQSPPPPCGDVVNTNGVRSGDFKAMFR